MAEEIISADRRAVDWVGPNHPGFIAEVALEAPPGTIGRVGRYQCGNKVLVGYSFVWERAA